MPRLPFGLDLKTMLIVLFVIYFVVPRVQIFMASRSAVVA